MFSNVKLGISNSINVISLIISFITVLFVLAGFLRIEIKLNDQDAKMAVIQRLCADERIQKPSAEFEVTFGSQSKEKAIRKRRTDPGVAGDQTFVAVSKLLEIRKEIKDNLKRMKEENRRVCRTPLGSRCLQGPPGEPGAKGNKGVKGDIGASGAPGVRGPPGQSGDSGDKGDKGDSGASGVPGVKGQKGEKGTQGIPGIPGQSQKPDDSQVGPPRVAVFPVILTVNENQTARFHCAATGDPKPVIAWRKDGLVLQNGHKYRVLRNGELIIRHAQYNDSGAYECVARTNRQRVEAFTDLVVRGTPRIKPLSQHPIYVIEGNDVIFPKCIATGFPSPSVTWSRLFFSLPKTRSLFNEGHLSVVNTTAGDSGVYICKAANSIGKAEVMTQLVVLTIPRFIVRPPEDLMANTGDILTVNCSAHGDQTLRVTWSREYAELPDRRATVRSDGTLVITQLIPEDAGKYFCTASSVGGAIKATADMNVIVVKKGMKRGICPIPLPADVCGEETDDECTLDSDCFGDMKCCSDSCQKLCVQPPQTRSCVDILYAGFNISGVYSITPDRRTEVQVFCDLETDDGGWIVFQRRIDASVGFHRTWEDYKRGFGNLKGNFWLGNNKIHSITSASKMILRIDLEDWSGRKVFALYENFKIGSEKTRYELTVSGYNGTSGDSLSYHNNMMFSTRDIDNDNWKTGSCSNDLSGGWWFNDCHNSNLNGQFLGNTKAYSGIGWARFRHNLSLKFVEMKMREQSFDKEREN